MAYQRYIKQNVLDALKDEVLEGIGLERYLEDDFLIENADIQLLPQVSEPFGLLERMNPQNEFQSAIELYEAYKDLSPIQATDVYFWESLSHLNLFKYIKSRWPVNEDTLTSSYISQHWFVESSAKFARHPLASLWWSVYLSIDDDSDDNPYELTEVLFRNQTFRTRTYGASLLFPIKEANKGILRYIIDHPDFVKNFEKVGNEISKYFNRLGAVKQLASLDKDFFYQEMGRAHDIILKAVNKSEY